MYTRSRSLRQSPTVSIVLDTRQSPLRDAGREINNESRVSPFLAGTVYATPRTKSPDSRPPSRPSGHVAASLTVTIVRGDVPEPSKAGPAGQYQSVTTSPRKTLSYEPILP